MRYDPYDPRIRERGEASPNPSFQRLELTQYVDGIHKEGIQIAKRGPL